MTAQYNDLSNNFGFGSSTSPSYFTPSNNAFDASRAWGPSSNWSASNYDWSGKNPNNPDFTSMIKSQTFGGGQQQPSEREKYNLGLEMAKALPKAISAFGGQQNGYGNAASSGLSSGNGVSTSGDLTFVTPQIQTKTTEGQQGLFSKVLGVAAPIVGLMGGPTAPFIAAGLGGLSRVV